MRGPDGVRCNDDSDGLNPVLDGSWAAGDYAIFVGTYHSGQSGNHTLHLEASRRSRRAARLDLRANDSVNGDGTLEGRRRRGGPVELSGVSGGGLDVSYLDRTAAGSCDGYVTSKPSHLVTLARDFRAVNFTVSGRGSSLIVATPSGDVFCNSDRDRGTSAIHGEDWPAGTYRVWVPSRREGVANDYQLSVDTPRRGRETRRDQMSFSGRFEQTDVTFSGRNADEVASDCQAFASRVSLSWVDDVQFAGRSYHNSSGYWNADALCSIAAANASSASGECGVSVQGTIESTPFAFCARDSDELAATVNRHLPNLVGSWVDDMVVNGQTLRNRSGYWNTQAVTAILLNSTPDESCALQASGTIESVPFTFSAHTPQELRSKCESFWTQFDFTWADDMVVNGETRRNRRGYWSGAEACMIVSSVSQQI